jgi:superoxide reductase
MAKYEVQTIQNKEEKTTLEKKHVPYIQAPDKVKKGEYFEVKINMGKEIDHPMEEGHYIQYLELYANYFQLARVSWNPEAKAEATLKVKLEESCKLRAFVSCNLHGQWGAEKDITVE